ncbi:hypothetical protein GCM10007939_19480 [Amylibacter marinus]|uniref:Aminoglycoside phosphotransferase domain-containing protein n=1 Tax=Amylibacter marinus TaxID=1475483 RepID=A0ABQ5VWM3_9RHOB|nr:phosphotransferase [Amylibacter marinus]GLQ35665.1 hypothetical protein GCM10007939_19480 [Amylibacter marinus]
MTDQAHIETALRALLVARGAIDAHARWIAQAGGQSNMVWHLRGADDVVCKLYLNTAHNPLYANDPTAEFACLDALAGRGIAPTPIGFHLTELGAVLLYRYVAGQQWRADGAAVADLLGRIQSMPAPNGLRHLPVDGADILAQGDRMAPSAALSDLRPQARLLPSPDLVLVHTDVVPGNLILGADGLRLIDWQCPAIGDGVVDVASFLSPAMHLIYTGTDITHKTRQAFLDALPTGLAARYHALAPAYHWRMAAYCQWCAQQGRAGYAQAGQAEQDLLTSLQ